jgi:hypothetical protein
MSPAHSHTKRRSGLALVLAIAVICPAANAQEEIDPQPREPRLEGAQARRVLQLRVRLLRQIVQLGSGGLSREGLNRELTKRVNLAATEYQLTDAQKTKLVMAGRGDIKRVLDRFETIQKRLNSADDAAKIDECNQDAAGLEADLHRGVFGRESLFAKTMATTITREQRARASEERAKASERRAKSLVQRRQDELDRYRANVADAAATLAVALGLSEEKKRDLKKLLTEEINPPLQIGESDRAYIMHRFSQVPAAKVKPIFNDAQWQLLSKIRSGWATRDAFLRRGGY